MPAEHDAAITTAMQDNILESFMDILVFLYKPGGPEGRWFNAGFAIPGLPAYTQTHR
jgi:hypothetical protein